MRRAKAEVAARKLLTLADILPISLENICERLGIFLRFGSIGSIDGMFIEDVRRVILVNDRLSLHRQRYSIAHELAHFSLRHGYVMFSCNLAGRDQCWQEREANIFAAELLMPKPILVRCGTLTPEMISKKCVVSLDAATIRARDLGWLRK